MVVEVEKEKEKELKREDVSTHVPRVGFQVAGRSVRPVSREQTALLNREMVRRTERGRELKKKIPTSIGHGWPGPHQQSTCLLFSPQSLHKRWEEY